jgi:hypothetical protein
MRCTLELIFGQSCTVPPLPGSLRSSIDVDRERGTRTSALHPHRKFWFRMDRSLVNLSGLAGDEIVLRVCKNAYIALSPRT